MADSNKIKHVVVDAGGFIRNAPLKDIAVNIYSISDIVREIKDKATRQRLQVLPYEIKFREPSAEAIKAVTQFAKKSGDYRSLSAVDIRVLAITYQLEVEHVGTDHIKTQPDKKIQWSSTTRHLENPTEVSGFYLGKQNKAQSRTTSFSQEENISKQLSNVNLDNVKRETDDGKESEPVELTKQITDTDTVPAACESDVKNEYSQDNGKENEPSEPITDGDTVPVAGESDMKHEDSHDDGKANEPLELTKQFKDGDTVPADCVSEATSEDSQDEEEEDEDEEEDDDDGWITPSNLRDVQKAMGHTDHSEPTVTVGCLTTDFAMQNVLIQMGLNVISVDGMLIKRLKNYVLRCFACMKITTKLELEFCPYCGNKTLRKLSMTVEEDGSVRYYFSRRKPITTRGTRYALPRPQGGKHASNPVLCADQPGAQQRLAKSSKVKYNPMDVDYVAHTSPFAPIDVTSRSAQLGLRSHDHRFKNRRNPNENRKVYGRRK